MQGLHDGQWCGTKRGNIMQQCGAILAFFHFYSFFNSQESPRFLHEFYRIVLFWIYQQYSMYCSGICVGRPTYDVLG